VHGLIPRHRRKAGSGPPATALIAWIGTDPYLRRAVAGAASHRRETELPAPANTRSAKVAVAVCFALACGAVLGVMATLSDGLVVPRGISTPPVLGQGNAATPGQGVSPDLPEEVDPHPMSSSTPAAKTPTEVNRQAPQHLSGPRADGQVDHLASDHPSQPDGYVRSGTTTPPARSVSPPGTDKPGDSHQPQPMEPVKPDKPVKPNNTGKPGDTTTLGGAVTPSGAANPSGAVNPDGAGAGTQGGSGNPGSQASPSPRISTPNQRSTRSNLGSTSRQRSAPKQGSNSSRK
jgi:hypothetical protein